VKYILISCIKLVFLFIKKRIVEQYALWVLFLLTEGGLWGLSDFVTSYVEAVQKMKLLEKCTLQHTARRAPKTEVS